MATSKQRIQIDLKKVEALAAIGCTHEEICLNLGISERTLYRRKNDMAEMAEAIKRGQAMGIREIENALFKKAKEGNTTAQIFFLANRAPDRWKSVNRTEVTGAGGTPISAPVINVEFVESNE